MKLLGVGHIRTGLLSDVGVFFVAVPGLGWAGAGTHHSALQSESLGGAGTHATLSPCQGPRGRYMQGLLLY